MTEETIFAAALEKCTLAARLAYLDEACAGDAALRQRVEALLESHFGAGGFLQVAAVERPGEGLDNPACSQETQGETPGSADSGALDFLSPVEQPGYLGRLGPYLIIEVIGRGGMGVVLKAFDPALHRVVAIKVMAGHLAVSATARKRFLREARAAAAVCHDHVITVHAVDEANGRPYMVMQYVNGISLLERLERAGPLALPEILRIGMQTAAGLAAAHGHGLIHRDIKPANILLENGVERVKITDFGLARAADDASLSHSGQVAGTAQYMAPEQARGEPLDPRADLFSLGSVLYALCTGRPPFRAENTMAVLKRVCEDRPRPIRELNPDIPDWLVQIIGKLHAKAPVDRYQSAAEVTELLGKHLAQLQQPSVVGQVSNLPVQAKAGWKPAPRHRRWATAAAVLVCLVAGLGLTEATGVTKLVPTVIRILTPDGTLVVETDDPGVKVTIEGDGGIVITGAGPQEVRLRPGSYKVRATKDGKPVHQEELVTISRGDKQVVRVRLEGQAPPPKAVVKADKGEFVVRGGKGVPGRQYATLAEAVLGASDGDTIEIWGNGPFVTPPIKLANNALTIRAAAGFRPVIQISPEGLENDEPLIETSARLILEGLDLQRVGQKRRKEYSRQPCIVVCDHASSFWFANCRFLIARTAGGGWCVYGHTSQTCVLRNCEFFLEPALRWDMYKRGRCLMENCLQVGAYPIGATVNTYDSPVQNVSIRFARNTVVVQGCQGPAAAITLNYATPKLPEAAPAHPPLRVEGSASIFDADAALWFDQVCQKLKPHKGAKAEAFLLGLVDWRDERNLYVPGASKVGWSFNYGTAVERHGPENLAQWKQFWRQGNTGSVEGRVRYQGGKLIARLAAAPEKITPEDFRLRPDSAGYRAGTGGKDLGADVDLVGPGAAYERWKKTPAYQQWVKDSGQLALEADTSPPVQVVAQPVKAAKQPEPQAFAVLTGKGVQVGKYASLAEALLGAAGGDTIEVRGNGPFVTPAINIGTSALTIRAGAGFRPIIKLSPERLERDDPLIETSAPLVLEGLELQRVGQKPRKEHRRQPSIVVCNRAPFWFANCRFVATVPEGLAGWAIASLHSQTCVVRNCEFLSRDLAVYWEMAGRGQCLMENCLCLGVNLLGGRIPASGVDKVSIRLAHNTVVRPTWQVLWLGLHSREKVPPAGVGMQPVRAKASGNIFDVYPYSVLGFDQEFQKQALRGGEAEALLLRLLDWREERNLYAPGTSRVAWAHEAAHGPKNLAEWNRFWRQADTGSLEGSVRYQGGNLKARAAFAPEKITPEDFRLRPDSAGYRDGKDGKDLGADVDLVGPGPAYQRWKRTPAYQQWLKDTGQVK
jgi:hypothetical protein